MARWAGVRQIRRDISLRLVEHKFSYRVQRLVSWVDAAADVPRIHTYKDFDCHTYTCWAEIQRIPKPGGKPNPWVAECAMRAYQRRLAEYYIKPLDGGSVA